jgi:putative Holliday junction resolvase
MHGHLEIIDNEQVYEEGVVRNHTVMAFDFGEQRIGIAVGEHLIKNASPLATIDSESTEVRFNVITQYISEWHPKLLIVGLPLNLVGEETRVCKLCRLNGRFNLPVILIDERFSSTEASEMLDQQGIHGRAQKENLDALAAATILQSYFSEVA